MDGEIFIFKPGCDYLLKLCCGTQVNRSVIVALDCLATKNERECVPKRTGNALSKARAVRDSEMIFPLSGKILKFKISNHSLVLTIEVVDPTLHPQILIFTSHVE